MNDLLTTNEVAKILDISNTRVRQLILSGKLPSTKRGRDHLIETTDLNLVKFRKPGRPLKIHKEKQVA
jgi:excisionase family DNA binding protein